MSDDSTRKNNRRRRKWTLENLHENHATTFSNDPKKDRHPLIGRTGRTTTALHPTGEIDIEGKTYDAVAMGAYIDPFEEVRVTGLRDFRLTVEKPN